MKVINILNFLRACEPRESEIHQALDYWLEQGKITAREIDENKDNYPWKYDKMREILFETAKMQLEMVKDLDLHATFLMQYDTLCDDRYPTLFREAGEKIELGLWLEVVKPLTDACGLPYDSINGWSWDWHIRPGFLPGYEPRHREMLLDEAMRKFKEIFGYYPKSVGSWLLDTHSVCYLSDKYDIHAFCICRDQVSTDAYTLIGGYFNQAYFPSRKNVFTPAKSSELTLKTPVFRMLAPDPIHNYDNDKYVSPDASRPVYTMEAGGYTGRSVPLTDWYYKSYFVNEDMGFSYAQIGQENSFCMFDLINSTKMHVERAKLVPDVEFMTLKDTGNAFSALYGAQTPATSVCALDNWDIIDCQSVYYDCKNYTANIFRHNKNVFIRSLYLFDENAEDYYISESCESFDGVYENQPVVDTVCKLGDENEDRSWILDTDGKAYSVRRISDKELEVFWGDKSVIFRENGMELKNTDISFIIGQTKAKTEVICEKKRVEYNYRGRKYAVNILCGEIVGNNGKYKICSDNGKILLGFEVEE